MEAIREEITLSVIGKEAQQKGWPMDPNFRKVPERIIDMHADLQKLIKELLQLVQTEVWRLLNKCFLDCAIWASATTNTTNTAFRNLCMG